MAVTSNRSGNSEWVKAKPEVIEFDLTNEGPPSKPLILTKDLKLNVVGAVTGVKYTWNGAGSVVDVDERDVPALLTRAMPRSCCGTIPTPYFVMLEG
jgi:hypothetical protein